MAEVKRMPFDGIVTHAVTKELQETLVGGRINKIYQPTDTELILTIRHQQTNYRLLISIHPSYARVHLTEEQLRNPETPPTFCMTLRKYMNGARIERLHQEDFERIITIDIQGRDEIGDQVYHQLLIEIMGRHSNVVLIETETKKIIHAMKPIPPSINRYRTLLPGASYRLPPPQDKLDPLKSTPEAVVKKLDFNQGRLDRQLVQHVAGFSPFIAKELVERTGLGGAKAYMKEFAILQKEIKEGHFQPAIYEGKREDFHVLPIQHEKKQASFSTVSRMLDAFFANKAERDRVKQQVSDLTRLIENERNKNKRKLKIHQQTLQQGKKVDTYQKYGELLTANMHRMKKGMKKITVTDYYVEDQPEITIPLKEDLSPSENAQRYFKRYRKLQRAQEKALKEIERAQAEIQYLEAVLQQLSQAREEDIEEIRRELEEEGYQRQRKQKRRKLEQPKPEQFLSSDGTTIYVGRNNKQNEFVTHRLAHKEDIWLHTLDIPGSHVVIKSANPSEETLLEAAQLAAYYSKARQSESVPVDYTKVKYVKKPKGGKPGFVTYTEQKTLFVTPKKLNRQAKT